jgi:hypothetical protein
MSMFGSSIQPTTLITLAIRGGNPLRTSRLLPTAFFAAPTIARMPLTSANSTRLRSTRRSPSLKTASGGP